MAIFRVVMGVFYPMDGEAVCSIIDFAGGGSFHHSSKVDLLLDCGLMYLEPPVLLERGAYPSRNPVAKSSTRPALQL